MSMLMLALVALVVDKLWLRLLLLLPGLSSRLENAAWWSAMVRYGARRNAQWVGDGGFDAQWQAR
jgi:hypothetical protein